MIYYCLFNAYSFEIGHVNVYVSLNLLIFIKHNFDPLEHKNNYNNVCCRLIKQAVSNCTESN